MNYAQSCTVARWVALQCCARGSLLAVICFTFLVVLRQLVSCSLPTRVIGRQVRDRPTRRVYVLVCCYFYPVSLLLPVAVVADTLIYSRIRPNYAIMSTFIIFI